MGKRPVVFVSFGGARSTTALSRAAEHAARFGAALHVLLVTWDHALARPDGAADERWLDAVIPREVPRRYESTVGHLVHAAVRYAQAHDAKLVVLPAEIGQSGSCVSAIAAAAEVPVLVAAERTSGDTVVAATDLHDARFPVIQRATEMIDDLETTLVGVHVVDTDTPQEQVEQRRSELAIALEPITLSPEVVVDREPDPADAVLAIARDRDADLIVVGVTPQTWLDSVLHPTVAARIVASAHRSVLLTPVRAQAAVSIS